MINWNEIETVMLDMDGTLLDLHFDNYFWQEYLPEYWGKPKGMDVDTAKAALIPRFKAMEGSLAWYCLDYWSEELGLDVFKLKYDVEHLIKTRPYTEELLCKLNEMDKAVVLVTNAHEKILDVKLEKTARTLGASPINVFFRITIPNAKKDIINGALMMWSRGLGEFGAIVILVYHPMTTPVLIFDRFNSYGLSYSAPLAAVIIGFSMLVFLIVRFITNRL